MSHHYSLRKKLLLYISLPLLLVSSITLGIAFNSAWHEIEEVYDQQLVSSAKVLLQLMEHELLEEESNKNFTMLNKESSLQHEYEKNIALRVWLKDRLVSQTSNAKIFENIQAQPGFSDQLINNEKWRFFVFLETENHIRIETSERYSIRYELIVEIIIALTVPLLIFIPAVLFITWKAINTNFKPVIAISSSVDKRNSDDLSPIPDKNLPNEIAPLIQAINRLFERISDSFKREKEFTDHAAHELRTPLAAMKTQAQVMQKRINTDVGFNSQEYSEDLRYLLQSIDRSTHMVNQLLLLSRLQNNELPFRLFNLSDCVNDVINNLTIELSEKNINLKKNIAEDITALGDVDSLTIMIKNLLENAIKYTPNNGSITLELLADGKLIIKDTGPGISKENHKNVFKRFFREHSVTENGSGLGLSIVKWIADAHNIGIQLRNEKTGGLKVAVTFNAQTKTNI